MSARRAHRRLVLDPSARCVPSDDVLHLVQRRGAFDLRGKNVTALHERIAPALNGRFTREEVLNAAGTHAAAVERYLNSLSEAGVLREARHFDDMPVGFPAIEPHTQVKVLASARVACACGRAAHGGVLETGL